MQSNTAPLLEILGVSNARFVMPVYQRGYSWDTERRRELWDDLVYAGETGKPHFIGSVLLERLPGGTATSLTRFNVVDGQQRLITVTILLDRLIRAFNRQGLADELDVKPAGLRRQYVFDTDAKGDMRYRMHPTAKDRMTLWSILGDAPAPDKPVQRILDAAHDFDTWLGETDPRTVWAGLRNLQAIDAELDEDDDAQRIFESMNAKGEDLAASDLVRNWVIMHVPYDDQSTFYDGQWMPFERLLNNDPKELDQFLRQFLIAAAPMSKRRGKDLYRLFKEAWGRADWDSSTVMRLLLEHANAWKLMFLHGEQDPKLADAYDRTGNLGILQVRPVMLALHSAMTHGRIDAKQMIHCCGMLESYLIRRTICRMPNTTPLTTVADRLVKTITDSTNIPRDIAATLLAPDSSDRTWCPDNTTFHEALQNVRLYHLRGDIPMRILTRLENWHHPYEKVTGTLTIEHIMPQTLSAEWRRQLGDKADEINEKWGDTLGNLTLSGANGSLQNNTFDVKAALAGKGYESSPLWLDQSLQGFTEWTPETIQLRASLLADEALKVWPMPSAKPSTTKEE